MRLSVLLVLLAACGTERAAPSDGSLGLPNERRVSESLIVGGRPDDGALRRAAEAGVETVIDLRQPSEPGFDEERATVERLGMRFVSIPVAGSGGLTEENARALHDALSSSDGDVVLHCASGNRVGALLALSAFYLERASADAALARGREAGLTGLEDAVRAHFTERCGADVQWAQCAAAIAPR